MFDDVAVPKPSTDFTLTCTISGLSQDTPVTWIGPDNNEISGSDDYVIDQGSFVLGSKKSTLIIKQTTISTLLTTSIYKCKLKSALYPAASPDVVKEMTLTLLELGKIYLANYLFCVIQQLSFSVSIKHLINLRIPRIIH